MNIFKDPKLNRQLVEGINSVLVTEEQLDVDEETKPDLRLAVNNTKKE